MTITQIRQKARALKVRNYSRLPREDLIWAIQRAEGNAECYRRIQGCGQLDCCWRQECQG